MMKLIFYILLAIAIIVTVYLAVTAKAEKKETPRPETERVNVPPEPPQEIPADVAVIYEGLRVRAAKHCSACGCEYDAAAAVCEICGEKL